MSRGRFQPLREKKAFERFVTWPHPKQESGPSGVVDGATAGVVAGACKQLRLDAGEVAKVLGVVAVVGGDNVPRLASQRRQSRIPGLPPCRLATTDVVAGRGDDDGTAVELLEDLAHARRVAAKKRVDRSHFGVVPVRLIELWDQLLAHTCIKRFMTAISKLTDHETQQPVKLSTHNKKLSCRKETVRLLRGSVLA